MLLGALALLAAGCGGSSSATPRQTSTAASFAGLTAKPPKPAPPFQLSDYQGHRVDLASLRGKAVLLTFLYTHCPDTCPLMTDHLHTALGELGPKARKVRILTVSVDPRGDTPAAVTKFLREHRMTGKMDWLVGSRSTLAPVWKQWGVKAQAPVGKRELVGHSAELYGIAASGKIRTLYPSNFTPAQIVHDVPLLASQ